MTTLISNRKKAGIPAGGEFASRTRSDSTVTLGSDYPQFSTPTEDQYNRAEDEARRQLAWAPDTAGTAAEIDDRIDAIANRLAEQEASWIAYQNGQSHPDDTHFGAIWSGKASGFSKSLVAQELQESKALLAALDSNFMDADHIAMSGMGNAGNSSSAVHQFIEEKIRIFTIAMDCSGRNLSVNQAAALADRRLAEVQPPF